MSEQHEQICLLIDKCRELGEQIATLETVIKDFIQWTHEYIYKIVISPPLMKPRLEELLERLRKE